MNPRTKQNLHTAMQAEALAYAKFARFAAAARMHEDVGLATLFQQSADVDRCHHFAQQAELAGIVGSSDDNLANAIEQTIHQIAMYEIFTRQAAGADGDQLVKTHFENIRKDHLALLVALRAAMKNEKKSEEAEVLAAKG